MENHFPNFAGFTYRPAIPYEEGVTRRDPSPVISVGGIYYVWYSRSTHDSSGYQATVWWATSVDGYVWEERGEALPAGSAGAFDEHAVFTPTILATGDGGGEGYWLYYTAVSEPFDNDDGGPRGNKTAIGVASADSPEGPWRRIGGDPMVAASYNAEEFDSHRVDDACLIKRDGVYRLYYKGRQLGKTPAETKMGLAIAERPDGPFRKFEGNPVIGSGHEVCVWPHGGGVASLMSPVGPEGNSMQYSDDGVVFRRAIDIEPPSAPGPYREDRFREGPGNGIRWGLCQDVRSRPSWPYLLRFDCDLTIG